MKSSIRQLPGILDMHGVGLSDRSYVLALGIARSLAYRLPIPTSPVEIPLSHFALTCLDAVNATLSEVNEQVVINVELALSLVKKLWLLRYNTVFEMDNVAVRQMLDSVVFEGSHEIPPATRDAYKKYMNQGLFDHIAEVVKQAAPTEGNSYVVENAA